VETDHLIVGGGPVGATLALLLARQGRKVLVVDGGDSGSKVCGEGILPAGWRVLERLGLHEKLTHKAPIEALVYQKNSASGILVGMECPLRQRAFGVQRAHLYQTFHHALREEGVEVWPGARLRDLKVAREGVEAQVEREGERTVVSSSFLTGADGLHSLVRRKAGLAQGARRRYMRWGARCYFRSSEQRNRVEVTLGDGVESYLTPLGEDLYGLAFLWSPKDFPRPLPGNGPLYERLMAYLPIGFEESLPKRTGPFWGGEKGIGPLEQPVVSPLHKSGRVALVGDAAGYLDALTGEGLCLGLRQAEALAECIAEGRLTDYPGRHKAIKFRHRMVVSGLLWLIHHEPLKHRVFNALFQTPKQYRAVVRFAVEEARLRELLTPQLPRFLLGLLMQSLFGHHSEVAHDAGSC